MEARKLDEHIEITKGVVGGKPRIAGRRITVQNIVVLHEWIGRSVDEIANEYDITLSDIYAALAYYYDHKSEIDASIRDDEVFIETLRFQTPSKLAEKLNAKEN